MLNQRTHQRVMARVAGDAEGAGIGEKMPNAAGFNPYLSLYQLRALGQVT